MSKYINNLCWSPCGNLCKTSSIHIHPLCIVIYCSFHINDIISNRASNRNFLNTSFLIYLLYVYKCVGGLCVCVCVCVKGVRSKMVLYESVFVYV